MTSDTARVLARPREAGQLHLARHYPGQGSIQRRAVRRDASTVRPPRSLGRLVMQVPFCLLVTDEPLHLSRVLSG